MISSSTRREMFLLMTIIGVFLSLAVFLVGCFWSVQMAPQILAEIGAGDRRALAARVTKILPVSVVGGFVFCGTLVSYWRYHRLAFPK